MSSTIQTYTIGDDELTLEKGITLSGAIRAIDLAIDDSLTGTFLFITYEDKSFIRVVDAKKMTLVDDVELPHATNLAGIVYDSQRKKIYAVDRLSNHLYSYSWDARNLSLEPDFDNPYYRELTEIVHNGTNCGTIGLALDAVNDRLYISDVTDEVKYYNVNDWSYEGKLSLSKSAIGIAVDPQQELLYYANLGYYSGSGFNSLVRYDLSVSDPNFAEYSINTGAPVAGITCDPNTGYVYATLFGDNSSTVYEDDAPQDSIQMFSPYDPNDPNLPGLTLVWDSPDIGNPAGIVFSNDDYKPSGIDIVKVADTSTCLEPGDFVTYTITAHSKAYQQTEVTVTDILPYAVNFVSAEPNTTGIYFPEDHVYVWEDLTLPEPNDPGDPNVSLYITVQINYAAEPNSPMVNTVTAESNMAYDTHESETEICCWSLPGYDPNIIYVDRERIFKRTYYPVLDIAIMENLNTGTSWEDAYSDLNDALARAGRGCGSEIRVAGGIYTPGTDPCDFFDIHDGVSVYGGYAGYGAADPNERDWKKYRSILNGYIDEYSNNSIVVALGNGSLLDGFTIEEAAQKGIDGSGGISTIRNCRIADCGNYGVYGDGGDFTLEHCMVEDNTQYGIYAEDGDVTLKWCTIQNNGWHGIEHHGTGYILDVENCRIEENNQRGLYTYNSTPMIKNCVVAQNGSDYPYYQGIYIISPADTPVLYNNTILLNAKEGIYRSGGSAPTVVNNIFYYNNDDGTQLVNISPTYCCIQNWTSGGTGNFNSVPGFAYTLLSGLPDPNDTLFHLAYNSPCVNGGDPTFDADDVGLYDIDGEERIYDDNDDIVDIGADEAYSCDGDLTEDDIYNPLDVNADGLVNFKEFAAFSAAWLSEYPDPNFNPTFDLYEDDVIDLDDFKIFCDPNNWLWISCWAQQHYDTYGTYAMSGGDQSRDSYGAVEMTAIAAQPVEEKTIEEQIFDLEDCIEFLEKIWMEEDGIQKEIDADDWKKFMDAVYQSLLDLKSSSLDPQD